MKIFVQLESFTKKEEKTFSFQNNSFIDTRKNSPYISFFFFIQNKND